MSLQVCSLASGSNGNCYYVGNEQEAILVDAGISCRELEKRMMRQSLRFDTVKAVFISHEHTDHISGLASVIKKYRLPVYISSATLSHCRFPINTEYIHCLDHRPVQVGALKVQGFSKIHDAADPYSFVISSEDTHVGVMTDIGFACQQVQHYFKQCQAVFLETNYDKELLMKGNYPWHLKKRISGGKGHISNEQALELFTSCRSASLSHLFLSHLSKNNNCPKLAQELFEKHSTHTSIVLASRDCETAVYHINGKDYRPLKVSAGVQQGVLDFG